MASQHISSSKKRFKTWKDQSRTGGNRQKILKDYRNIINYNVEDTNLSQDNLNESGSITRRGQVGVLLDEEGSVCNGSDIATASFDISEEDRCYYSLSSDDEDNSSEYVKNLHFSEKLRHGRSRKILHKLL